MAQRQPPLGLSSKSTLEKISSTTDNKKEIKFAQFQLSQKEAKNWQNKLPQGLWLIKPDSDDLRKIRQDLAQRRDKFSANTKSQIHQHKKGQKRNDQKTSKKATLMSKKQITQQKNQQMQAQNEQQVHQRPKKEQHPRKKDKQKQKQSKLLQQKKQLSLSTPLAENIPYQKLEQKVQQNSNNVVNYNPQYYGYQSNIPNFAHSNQRFAGSNELSTRPIPKTRNSKEKYMGQKGTDRQVPMDMEQNMVNMHYHHYPYDNQAYMYNTINANNPDYSYPYPDPHQYANQMGAIYPQNQMIMEPNYAQTSIPPQPSLKPRYVPISFDHQPSGSTQTNNLRYLFGLPYGTPIEQPITKLSQKQKNFCFHILHRLKSHKSSAPFRQPVNPETQGVPDYYDCVYCPMDLSTIGKKILKDKYRQISQFHADINRIILNSYKYNRRETNYFVFTVDFQDYYQELLRNAQDNPEEYARELQIKQNKKKNNMMDDFSEPENFERSVIINKQKKKHQQRQRQKQKQRQSQKQINQFQPAIRNLSLQQRQKFPQTPSTGAQPPLMKARQRQSQMEQQQHQMPSNPFPQNVNANFNSKLVQKKKSQHARSKNIFQEIPFEHSAVSNNWGGDMQMEAEHVPEVRPRIREKDKEKDKDYKGPRMSKIESMRAERQQAYVAELLSQSFHQGAFNSHSHSQYRSLHHQPQKQLELPKKTRKIRKFDNPKEPARKPLHSSPAPTPVPTANANFSSNLEEFVGQAEGQAVKNNSKELKNLFGMNNANIYGGSQMNDNSSGAVMPTPNQIQKSRKSKSILNLNSSQGNQMTITPKPTHSQPTQSTVPTQPKKPGSSGKSLHIFYQQQGKNHQQQQKQKQKEKEKQKQVEKQFKKKSKKPISLPNQNFDQFEDKYQQNQEEENQEYEESEQELLEEEYRIQTKRKNAQALAGHKKKIRRRNTKNHAKEKQPRPHKTPHPSLKKPSSAPTPPPPPTFTQPIPQPAPIPPKYAPQVHPQPAHNISQQDLPMLDIEQKSHIFNPNSDMFQPDSINNIINNSYEPFNYNNGDLYQQSDMNFNLRNQLLGNQVGIIGNVPIGGIGMDVQEQVHAEPVHNPNEGLVFAINKVGNYNSYNVNNHINKEKEKKNKDFSKFTRKKNTNINKYSSDDIFLQNGKQQPKNIIINSASNTGLNTTKNPTNMNSITNAITNMNNPPNQLGPQANPNPTAVQPTNPAPLTTPTPTAEQPHRGKGRQPKAHTQPKHPKQSNTFNINMGSNSNPVYMSSNANPSSSNTYNINPNKNQITLYYKNKNAPVVANNNNDSDNYMGDMDQDREKEREKERDRETSNYLAGRDRQKQKYITVNNINTYHPHSYDNNTVINNPMTSVPPSTNPEKNNAYAEVQQELGMKHEQPLIPANTPPIDQPLPSIHPQPKPKPPKKTQNPIAQPPNPSQVPPPLDPSQAPPMTTTTNPMPVVSAPVSKKHKSKHYKVSDDDYQQDQQFVIGPSYKSKKKSGYQHVAKTRKRISKGVQSSYSVQSGVPKKNTVNPVATSTIGHTGEIPAPRRRGRHAKKPLNIVNPTPEMNMQTSNQQNAHNSTIQMPNEAEHTHNQIQPANNQSIKSQGVNKGMSQYRSQMENQGQRQKTDYDKYYNQKVNSGNFNLSDGFGSVSGGQLSKVMAFGNKLPNRSVYPHAFDSQQQNSNRQQFMSASSIKPGNIPFNSMIESKTIPIPSSGINPSPNPNQAQQPPTTKKPPSQGEHMFRFTASLDIPQRQQSGNSNNNQNRNAGELDPNDIQYSQTNPIMHRTLVDSFLGTEQKVELKGDNGLEEQGDLMDQGSQDMGSEADV